MKALILRNMTVANAKGEAQAFEKSDVPVTIDDVETYRRLNRAGAAVVYMEEKAPESSDAAEGVDIDKLNKAGLIDYAAAEKIEIDADATKAVILEAIKAAKAAKASEAA